MNSLANQSPDSQIDSSRLKRVVDTVYFVQQLMCKYDWKQSEREEIDKDLRFMNRKINDKYLNLSIVGEFSSGKSTFINALLREDLLESDNVQGTTTAKTVLRYAPKYDVIAIFKNGTMEKFSDKRKREAIAPEILLSEVRQHIKELTTNPESKGEFLDSPSFWTPKAQYPTQAGEVKEVRINHARELKEIVIEHPAEILKKGIAIIDTPGTDSLERWHEDITREAITELSDVSVILTTADKPLPKTLNEFVKENLSDVLSHCVFVATKMDNVREGERERQLAYIKQKAAEEFGLGDATILPYSPMFVLGEADPDYRSNFSYEKDDYRQLLEESLNTEKIIFQRLAEQRINIQVQKLSCVLKQTLSNLQSSIHTRLEQYKERHAILEKHQKSDFVEWINGMAERYLAKLEKEADATRKQMWESLTTLHGTLGEKFLEIYYALPNIDAVLPFCENQLPSMLNAFGTQLIQQSHEYFKKLPPIATRLMNEFGEEFTQIYSELATLDLNDFGIQYDIKQSEIRISSFEPTSLKEAISNLDVGGFLDALFFGPSRLDIIDSLDKILDDHIGPYIEQWDEKIEKYINNDINGKVQELCELVTQHMNKYLEKYQELIASMIRREQEEKRELEKYIAMTEADKAEIEHRQLGAYIPFDLQHPAPPPSSAIHGYGDIFAAVRKLSMS